MKKANSKFALSLIFAILAVAACVATFVIAIATGKITMEQAFRSEDALGLLKAFDFHDTSLPVLVSVIGFGVIEAFFVVDLILLIVKRRPLFLIPLFLFGIAGSYAVLLAYQLLSVLAINDLLIAIFSYASVGLGVVASLVLFFCLLATKRPEPAEKKEKERVEPVAAPKEEAAAPAPAAEDAAPIEYVEPHAPLNYADEEGYEEEEVAPAPAPVSSGKSQKTLGKYEIYPEAGFFKYRLKANNGEILLVSHGYRTREGARAGIATLKKNVATGVSKIITDKNGFSQFRIFTMNDSRLIVAGEFYSSSAAAQKALNSVQRFYLTDKIVDLDEIPESEVREWKVDLPPMNPSKNGKFEVYIEEESKKWQGRLVANNGAVLFVTSTYSSKNAVINAFSNIKSKVIAGDLDIARDKQNRYHFRIISENGSVILMGETYPSRESAISAAVSVRNFIGDAKTIDLSRGV